MKKFIAKLFGQKSSSSIASGPAEESSEPSLPSDPIISDALYAFQKAFDDTKHLYGKSQYKQLKASAIHESVTKTWSDSQRAELLSYLFSNGRAYSEYTSKIYSRKPINHSIPISTEERELVRFMCAAYLEWPKLILQRKISFNKDSAVGVITALVQNTNPEKGATYGPQALPISNFLKHLNKSYAEEDIPLVVTFPLKELRNIVAISDGFSSDAKRRKLLQQFDELLAPAHSEDSPLATVKDLVFTHEDPYTDAIISGLEEHSYEDQDAWVSFIRHALTADSLKVTKKFSASTLEHLNQIGKPAFEKITDAWFEFLFAMPRTDYYEVRVQGQNAYLSMFNGYLTPSTTNLMRGVVHARSFIRSGKNVEQLERLAFWAVKTIPGVGPCAKPIGLACFNALTQLPDAEGMAAITRLRARIKRPSILKSLDRAINAAAEKQDFDIGELADNSTPDFGLIDGSLSHKIGHFAANLNITSPGKSQTSWTLPSGKIQKSVPAEVKEKFSGELKTFKKTIKALNTETSAQRDRIENFYRDNRTWKFVAFAKTFHSHALLNWFSRKLIWNLTTANQAQAIRWSEGAWRKVDGEEILPTDDAEVQLWHPANSTADEVAAWRTHCYAEQLVQPFKQAFREVYLLTPAEETTATYSNRFAGHILEQGQLNGLCRARSWQKSMLGSWDGGDATLARLRLPAYNLEATYLLDFVGTDQSDYGYHQFVGTDQVRFQPSGSRANADPIPLTEIPIIAFSEVMRDCDLFVSVAGVANDPTWADRGNRTENQRDYWRSSSFGELTSTALTRREILVDLLPRLKIRKVASLSEKFLVVQGTRRTYKIHLGSGNVLMEPNDQYLCIVAAPSSRSKTSKLYVPFSGDAKLSLILSKAFLLAADDKIEDETILRQLAQ